MPAAVRPTAAARRLSPAIALCGVLLGASVPLLTQPAGAQPAGAQAADAQPADAQPSAVSGTSSAVAAVAQLDPVAVFDTLAERARGDWDVPGLAVAVVHGGEVRLAKGYGLRTLGGADPVDADTLFAAASTTKAMTAAALGMLVDEGKLGWDDPVRKFIPELAFGDAELADELTVRDLLTHHTGLPETDYLWFASDLSWPQILARLAAVERNAPARSRFEYQNVMYGIAGDLIGRVAGMPWEEVVRQRIFLPLGMDRSVPLGGEVAARGNYVSPHSREDGVLTNALALVDPIPAAGSAWTSANDVTRWMRFLLAPEAAAATTDADAKPLLRPATIEELFRPQVLIQPDAFYPTAEVSKPRWTSYGLGWFQQDYRGRKIDFHTGSIDGLVAIVGLVREANFGVAIYANLDHAELRHALMFSAFDLFLDGGLSRDWNGDLRALYDARRARGEARQQELEAKRVANAPPSLPIDRYVGTYEHPLRGRLQVSAGIGDRAGDQAGDRVGEQASDRASTGTSGGGLHLGFGTGFVAGALAPWHFDTFRVSWTPKFYGTSWATFRLGVDGTVAAVEVDGVRYERVPEPTD